MSDYTDLAAKVRECDEKMTPGEWTECGHDRGGCKCHAIWSLSLDCPVAQTLSRDDEFTQGEGVTDAAARRNAEAIAFLRNNLPAIADALTAQDAEIARLRDERREAVAMAHVMCGPDDTFPDDLHLADVIEKHVFRAGQADADVAQITCRWDWRCEDKDAALVAARALAEAVDGAIRDQVSVFQRSAYHHMMALDLNLRAFREADKGGGE